MARVYNNYSNTTRNSQSIYNDDGHTYDITEENNIYVSESYDISVDLAVTKSREDEQIVSGWANVAKTADGARPLDWQDDLVDAEVLEKAAINFMLEYRSSGEMHKGDSKGTIVESIVLTKAKQEALGIPEGTVAEGWFITVKVHDKDVFAKVKDGTYKMFSIQGKAKKIKL
jgi:hypothetical protein